MIATLAVAECERALEIDPFSLRINQHLGDSFYYGRRYDEAVRQYQQTLELDPHNCRLINFNRLTCPSS